MKNFKILKNGGIFKFENNSKHNNLSSFLTLINLSGFKKSHSFSYCKIPYQENLDLNVKEYILSSHSPNYKEVDLATFFKSKNAQALFELINFRIDTSILLKHLSSNDLELVTMITSLMNPPVRPLLIEFTNQEMLCQNLLPRLIYYLKNTAQSENRAIFICGKAPALFNQHFELTITRDNESKFSLEQNMATNKILLQDLKISA